MTNPDYTFPLDPFDPPEASESVETSESETVVIQEIDLREQKKEPATHAVSFLQDCPKLEATKYIISTLDEDVAQAYAQSLKTRLRDWVQHDENENPSLEVSIEGKNVIVTSLDGRPIYDVSLMASHIAASVQSIAFKK